MIITLMKKIVFIVVLCFIKIRRLVFGSTGVAFLAPDIPKSNLGDQALLCGAIEGIRSVNPVKATIILSGPEEVPSAIINTIKTYGFTLDKRFPILFATESAFKEKILFYWTVSKYKTVLLVGADVLDGTYNAKEAARKINIMSKFADIGLISRIYGFSLSTNISLESELALKKASTKVQFFARDYLSQQRTLQFQHCELVADCAFLMKPTDLTENVSLAPFLSWKDQSSLPILGVCIRDKDIALDNALTSLANVLIKLLKKAEFRLLLVPHYPSDITTQKQLLAAMDSIDSDSVYIFEELPLATEIKAITAECKHMLTSRMHVAIASLGMCTPVTCIPYAGKFEGLLKHFELGDAIFPIEQVLDEECSSTYLLKRLGDSDMLASEISAKLPQILKLSAKSFEGIGTSIV